MPDPNWDAIDPVWFKKQLEEVMNADFFRQNYLQKWIFPLHDAKTACESSFCLTKECHRNRQSQDKETRHGRFQKIRFSSSLAL